MAGNLLVRSVRIRGDDPTDILIQDGIIASIAPNQKCPNGTEIVEGANCLALPGLVEAHTHLGYSLIGRPWYRNAVGPKLIDKIENERREVEQHAVDVKLQTVRQIKHCAALGSTYLRGHVAIDVATGIRVFEEVLSGVAETTDLMDVQLVAFPQGGLLTRPGTLELMDEALRLGADVVGGIDPAAIDRDPCGHLDAVFGLSQKHGKPIDIHLHEAGELGAFTTELVIERTRALGLSGRVMLSHAFCLGAPDTAMVAGLLDGLASAGISVMTTGPSGRPCPVLKDLRAAGVTLCAGSDGIRDMWGPYNSGDLLERAAQIGMRNNLRRDDEFDLILDTCSAAGATAMGLLRYGVTPGSQADLVLIAAETVAEAVVAHPPRELVVKRGNIVSRRSFVAGLSPYNDCWA